MIISVNDFLNLDIKDEVFVIETDTVYGIGCLLNSKIGVERIYHIKGREFTKPLAVLCSNVSQVESLVYNVSDFKEITNKYWPGPLTLVFKKKDTVGNFVTSNFDTVGIRIPNNDICLKIMDKFGPIVMTSLNKSHEKEVVRFCDTVNFINDVDYIVEGHDLENIPSTVYDTINKKVLRQGKIYL